MILPHNNTENKVTNNKSNKKGLVENILKLFSNNIKASLNRQRYRSKQTNAKNSYASIKGKSFQNNFKQSRIRTSL